MQTLWEAVVKSCERAISELSRCLSEIRSLPGNCNNFEYEPSLEPLLPFPTTHPFVCVEESRNAMETVFKRT